jgi:hypothetical protein
LETSDEQV